MTTLYPGGTCAGPAATRAPRRPSPAPTWGLWIRGPRVATFSPASSRRPVSWTARSTPKQKPAVFAKRISMFVCSFAVKSVCAAHAGLCVGRAFKGVAVAQVDPGRGQGLLVGLEGLDVPAAGHLELGGGQDRK